MQDLRQPSLGRHGCQGSNLDEMKALAELGVPHEVQFLSAHRITAPTW